MLKSIIFLRSVTYSSLQELNQYKTQKAGLYQFNFNSIPYFSTTSSLRCFCSTDSDTVTVRHSHRHSYSLSPEATLGRGEYRQSRHNHTSEFKNLNEGEIPKLPRSQHRRSNQAANPGEDLLELERESGNISHTSNKYSPETRRSNDHGHGDSSFRKGIRSNKRFSTDVQIKGEVLFGTFPVLFALRAGRRCPHALHIKRKLLEAEPQSPYISQMVRLAAELNVPVLATNRGTLEALSGGRPHQGVCLDAGRLAVQRLPRELPTPPTEASNIVNKNQQLWVVLESIYDPMNFGAILRSCYFLGVDGVITVKDKSCPPTPVVSKASAGLMELAPIWTVSSVVDFIQDKKTEGWQIVGTVGVSSNPDPRTIPLAEARLHSNTLLLMGNEGSGLSAQVVALCHQLVTVTSGRKLGPDVESLNVSVATGIILHHLLSQRQ